MQQLATPDITKGQLTGLGVALVGALTAAGVPLSEANENRIYTASLGIGVALVIADAVIRFGRALMQGKKLTDADLDLE